MTVAVRPPCLNDPPETTEKDRPLVSLLETKFVRGWPDAQDAGPPLWGWKAHGRDHAPIAEILPSFFGTDAHFSAYSATGHHPRLTVKALEHVASVPMVLMVFDIDCPASHKASGGSGVPAPDAWFELEYEKIEHLAAVHGTPFVYRTKGGYRIVFVLAAPFYITKDTQAAWATYYVRCCCYLAREFGITADPACSDWTHLYRAPFATREVNGKPENLPAFGDPNNLARWDVLLPESAARDLSLARALAEENPGWRKRGLGLLQRVAVGVDHDQAKPKPTVAPAPTASTYDAADADERVNQLMPLDDRVTRAKKYIDKKPGAVSGQGGHSVTFSVAVVLVRGLALPRDVAMDLMRVYNAKCTPAWSESELLHKVVSAERANAPLGFMLSSDLRHEIVVTTQEHEVVEQALLALAADPLLYVRGGTLVQVVTDSDSTTHGSIARAASTPRIALAAPAFIRERLTSVARLVSVDPEHGKELVHPPPWLVPEIAARATWPKLRKLRAVTEIPVLRPDGTILDKPGYDAATGLLYRPNADFLPVPPKPTMDEVRDAVIWLRDLLGDFPFASEVHEAAGIAAMFNPFFRFAFSGPTPATCVDAATAGTGKNLFIDVVSTIGLGRPMPRMPQPRDETEEAKRILAIALAGDLQVLIDNLTRPLGSGVLDAALTSTEWRDRILGASEMVSVPFLTQLYFTGNNIQFVGDTSRRVLHVRMESTFEQPELRTGFKYPDLLRHVRQNRVEYVRAILVIARAFYDAGAPSSGLPAWGSFEAWSGAVRAAVVFAGLPDPGLTRGTTLGRADIDMEAVVSLFNGIGAVCKHHNSNRVTAQEIAAYVNIQRQQHRPSPLGDAIVHLARMRANQEPTGNDVGFLLRRYNGRVVGGQRLLGEKVGDRTRWTVERVDHEACPVDGQNGDGGDRGDPPSGKISSSINDGSHVAQIPEPMADHHHHHDHHAQVIPLRPIGGR